MNTHYVCYASSQGSNDCRGSLGPLYYNLFDKRLVASEIILPLENFSQDKLLPSFHHQKNKLKNAVIDHAAQLVLSGDHSSAMGTWQAMLEQQPDIHLVWMDAHLDAHNPNDSESNNVHGMPIAYLLGDFTLPNDPLPIAKHFSPCHIHMIGPRSFEPIEKKKLDDYGVSIYSNDDIADKGLESIIQHVLAKIGNAPYGVSLDLDLIDPVQSPGVNCPTPDGINANDLIKCMPLLLKQCKCLELTEYNPSNDLNGLTLGIISEIINCHIEAC